jgi:hypothetical protein
LNIGVPDNTDNRTTIGQDRKGLKEIVRTSVSFKLNPVGIRAKMRSSPSSHGDIFFLQGVFYKVLMGRRSGTG